MDGACAGRIEQRGSIAAMDGADRTVQMPSWLALENGAAFLDLRQTEAERLANLYLATARRQLPKLLEAGQT
jgi:hypothetical protein